MGALFDLADKLDARVLLTGDRNQHGSVARGDMLRLLEEEAGCTPADVAEIKRQSGDYKLAVKALSEGKAAEGFRNRLPLELAHRFTVFRSRNLNLARGDWIRITHNGYTADGKHRLDNGAFYRVDKFDQRGNIVLENGWKIAKDFGHLAHGYVVTSHASQGRTVNRVLIAQSSMPFPASSREQFYVSCSRGSEGVTVYCDDKKSLQEAVTQSEERVTATDLVKQQRAREVVQMHRRQAEHYPEPQSERQRELIHER